jgi:toxin ParE1/3/4
VETKNKRGRVHLVRNAGLAERYEQGLRHAIDIIADNPHIAVERQEYAPPVRVHHHAKHFIIYLIEDAHILIVRVLRDEVDLTKHLRTAP